MPPPDASRELYRTLQRLQLVMVATGRRAWSRMRPDFDPAWAEIAPGLLTVTAAAQLAAARAATEYVPTVLAETGQPDEPLARVRPEAFAGVASDGRSLAGLLAGAPRLAKVASGRGMASDAALGYGGRWLEKALRTAVADAARDATATEVAVRRNMGWVRMVNPPCCRDCAVLAGRWYRFNEGFDRHPRCLPAGVVVSTPGVEAATRRWYEGELVLIRTASGQELPVTGNHPVLTTRGWVPAHLVQEGDDVARSINGHVAPAAVHPIAIPDEDHVPTLIEDVWRSHNVVSLGRVPTSAEDFHGDGGHGEVDVVTADGLLWNRRLTKMLKPRPEAALVVRDESVTRVLARGGLSALGSSRQLRFITDNAGKALAELSSPVRPSTRFGEQGEPGRFCLARLLVHPESRSAANVSQWNSRVAEAKLYSPASHTVLPSQIAGAYPAPVLRDQGLDRKVTDLARWDAPSDPFSIDSRDAYSTRGRDLLNRLAGQIELDRVVEVRRSAWSGHVYNLSSVEGWYSAANIILSNCDCVHIPATENASGEFTTDPRLLLGRGLVTGITKDQRARLDDGADPIKVLNESRDRWRERMAADRRARGPVDRLGRSRPAGWAGGGSNPPPVGTTIHQLLDRLTSQVDAARAMRAAGIAD